jgi:hypothetical protein
MSGLFGHVVSLAQDSGTEIELRVHGDEDYARYETVGGHTVVYDRARGLYCYARLDANGAFLSTGVPATQPPPAGTPSHLEEVAGVRSAKAAAKSARRAPGADEGSGEGR